MRGRKVRYSPHFWPERLDVAERGRSSSEVVMGSSVWTMQDLKCFSILITDILLTPTKGLQATTVGT